MSRIKTLLLSAAVIAAAGFLSLMLLPSTPAAASNTYPYGQCTYYAKSQRPDIGNYWGNAKYWANAARRNGFSVSSTPRVGDVVVFGAYVQGNSPYGHVGIVASVSGSRFKVVSMWGNEATGRIHLNWHSRGYGVSFIHQRLYTHSAAPPKKVVKAPSKPAKPAPPKAAPPKKAPPKAAPPKKKK